MTDLDLAALVRGDVPVGDLDAHCPHRATVAFEAATADVRTNAEAALRYVLQLFGPGNRLWRVAEPVAEPSVVVRLWLAPRESVSALVRSLRTGWETAGRPGAVPARLHVDARGEWVNLAAGRRVLVLGGGDDRLDPQVVVAEGGGGLSSSATRDDAAITMICSDTPDAMMNLARHLREIGYRHAENAGWVCFHASAAVMDGRAVAVIGDSGAGKTTMAVALATLPGWAFLANDRLMVRREPTGHTAVAMPCPIRFNAGTLVALDIGDAATWRLTRPKPPPNSDWTDFRGDTKLNVLPSEWQERTGTRLATAGRLAAVLFPRPVLGGRALRMESAGDRAAELVRAQCMSPDDPVYVEDWLGVRRVSADCIAETAARAVGAMAALPSFLVEFGTARPLGEVAADVAAAVQERW